MDISKQTLINDAKKATHNSLDEAAALALQDKRQSMLERYNYDLVFGVTLGSINAQLARYMDKVASKLPHEPLYIIRQGDQPLALANSDVTKQLNSLNLFDIPTDEAKRTEAHWAAWNKACNDLGFAYGYDAAPGFLKASDKTKVLDFEAQEVSNDSKVTYRPFFKKFIILENQKAADGTAVLHRYQQSPDKAWTLSLQVHLGLENTALELLPEEIRERINAIDSGKLFSISQLFLNTKSFTIKTMPDPWINSSRQQQESLIIFFQRFFKQNDQVGGDFALGYNLATNPSATKKDYLVEIIDFRYYISPYVDQQGLISPTNKDLYTLNFIGIASPRSFPALKPLSWNWIDVDKKAISQGALAIRGSCIMDFAAKQFSQIINGLLLMPSIHTNMSLHSAAVSFNYCKPERMPWHTFDHNYHLAYTQAAHVHDKGAGIELDIDSTYSVQSQISWSTNHLNKAIIEFMVEIITTFQVETDNYIIWHTYRRGSGQLYCKQIKCTLELNIGNGGRDFGKLLINPTVQSTDIEPQYDISKVTNLNVLPRSINNASAAIAKIIDPIVNQFENDFKKRFDGQSFSWFVPGSEAAAYSDTSWSDGGDLVFNMSLTNETTI